MVVNEQLNPSENIRPEILQTINLAEKVIAGNYGSEPPGESLDPETTFSGPILDLNDNTLAPEEKTFLQSWIEKKLGMKPEKAPVKERYQSPDGQTTFSIYDRELGDGWFLSCWQNQGEEPSFVFWPQDFYDMQELEFGYERLE